MKSVRSNRSISVAMIVFGIVLGSFAAMARAADANLHVQFTTTDCGGTYAPRHVHVVWIKDSAGNFVATIGTTTTDNKRAVWANNQASRLIEWYSNNPQANTDVAAQTGATMSTFQTYSFDWNWRNTDGSIVPDGDYQIHFLQTSSNSGTPNNKASFTISKGVAAWSTTPVSQGGYNNVSFSFTPAGLGVSVSNASNVTSWSATLNGSVTGTDGVDPQVYIYWGQTDGGTTSANWDHEVNLGTLGAGPFSTDITDLVATTTYYYRCRVVTASPAKDIWTDSAASFTTPTPDTAQINMVPGQLDFGQVELGTSRDVAVTVQNLGQLPLQINSLELVGLESDVYTLVSTPSLPLTLNAVPGYSWANQDIGNVSIPGSTVDNGSTIILEGSGADIWNNTDEFQFYYASLTGDGSITARVDSLENTDMWSKSGVMMRDTLEPGSKNVYMAMSYSNGATFQWRTATNGATSSTHDNLWAAPYWVRLVRSGNTFTGYVSPDGQNWVNQGNQTFTMNSTLYIGLAVTSHNDGEWDDDDYEPGQLCTSVFSNLSVTPASDPEEEIFTVRFTPKSVQDYAYAKIAIASNDPDKIGYVELSGAGGPEPELGTRQVGGIGGAAKAVTKYGDNVLLGQGAMLVLIDVSNPAAPVKLNQIRLEGIIEAIAVQGDAAYVALGNKGFAVVDLKDFMPLKGALTTETGGFAYDIACDQNLLCIADGIAGTHVYDITSPLEPTLVSTFETNGAATSLDIFSNLIYVLDEHNGVYVIDPQAIPLESSLTTYLKLNETSGLVASDSSLHHRNGTLMNMDDSDWVSGIFGNALELDGVDDYITINGYKGITGGASRTCMAWIKTTDHSDEILTWGEDTTGGRWVIRSNYSGGQLRAEVNGGNIIGTTPINDGQWHHIAVVLNNDGTPNISEAKLYVDGLLEPTLSAAPCEVNTGSYQDVQIGMYYVYNGSYNFQGQVDDVRIYDTALTEQEVKGIASQQEYDGIEFGTGIAVGQAGAFSVDEFGSLLILDTANQMAPQSVTMLQSGSASDIALFSGYTYVSSPGGLEVLDTSNPASPLSIYFDPNIVGSDIGVDGLVAYLAAGSDGIVILDTSNPADISLLGSYSLMSASSGVASDSLGNVYVVGNQQNLADYNLSVPTVPAVNNTYEELFHAEDIEIQGQYAFVAAGLSGLNVFDLSNPSGTPAAVVTTRFASALSVNGSTAMVCDSNDVYVVDVSSPMSPALIGTMSLLGWGSDVAVGSTHGYVAEGGMGISILSLADAQFAGSYPVTGTAYGVAIEGNLLYVACGTSGITILDVTEPSNPSLVAEYDLPGMIVDVAIVNDKLCVADATYGVSILDISNAAVPNVYANAATSAPAFHISSAGSRILVADKNGGLAVLGLTDWSNDLIGDISGDAKIDLNDLFMIAGQWLNSETNLDYIQANIDYYDTIVNMRDLSALSSNWMVEILPTSLVAYWKMNETTGSTASDATLNGRNGTLVNMDNSDWVSGKSGNALDLDGVDDYIEVSGYKGVTGGGNRTCTAWIKTTTASKEILSWGNNDSGRKWIIRINETGALRTEVQGGYIYGTTSLIDDTWHHIAVVLDNDGTPDISEVSLYVDGQLDVIADVADEPIDTAAEFDVAIGVFPFTGYYRHFDGLIDDVRIYDTALTEQEIAELAQ